MPRRAIWVYTTLAAVSGLAGMIAGALTIDRLGRRTWFITSFAAGALMLALGSATSNAAELFACICVAYFFTAIFSLALYLYVSELFSTRARALAVGAASAWTRLISLLVPAVAGGWGLTPTFIALALVAAAGALVTALLAAETKA